MKFLAFLMVLISFDLFADGLLENNKDFIVLKEKVDASCSARKRALKRAKLSERQMRKCEIDLGNIITERLNWGQYRKLTNTVKRGMKKLEKKCLKVCSRYLPAGVSLTFSEKDRKLNLGECKSYKVELMRLMREKGSSVVCRNALKEIDESVIRLSEGTKEEVSCLPAKQACVASFDSVDASKVTDVSICRKLPGISKSDAQKCAQSEKLSLEISDIQRKLSKLRSEVEYRRIIKTFSRSRCNSKSKARGFAKRSCADARDYKACCEKYRSKNKRYAKLQIRKVQSLTKRLIKASAGISSVASGQGVCLGCSVSEQNQSFKVEDPDGLLRLLNERLMENYEELSDNRSSYDQYYFNRQKELREELCNGIRDNEGFLSPRTPEDVARCIRFNTRVYSTYKGEHSINLKSKLFMTDGAVIAKEGGGEMSAEEKRKHRELLVEKFNNYKGFDACIKPLDVFSEGDEKNFHDFTQLVDEISVDDLDLREKLKVKLIEYALMSGENSEVPKCNDLANRIESFFDDYSSDPTRDIPEEEFVKITNQNFKLITGFVESLKTKCEAESEDS